MIRNIVAVARLTFAEGIRMRILLVVVLVLAFITLRLPFTVRGDETVAGQLQTFLSYSLGAVSLLLGLATVFLSCATLTGDVKNCTIHLVLTKPVSRFEVLAGKWLGINVLMLLLVALCTAAIYGFATVIKNRPVAFARDRVVIRDVVWRARVGAKPKPPVDLHKEARQWVENQLKQGQEFARGFDAAIAARVKELETQWRKIAPGHFAIYVFENLIPPREAGAKIQVRYRARGQPTPIDEMLAIDFAFADPETFQPIGAIYSTRERINEWHQFLADGRGVIRNGKAALLVGNPLPPDKRTAIFFDQDEWLELLYNIGSFEENYLKTVLLIIGRLSFLAALGLFFSVFTSFPVACFCVLTVYMLCLGMPWWEEAIGARLEYRSDQFDLYGRFGPFVRLFLFPLMRLACPDFSTYDGIERLVAGHYIPVPLLLKGLAHTLGYGAMLLFLPGWLIFLRREIAEVTV